jgi:hypothetical protein
MYGMRSGVLTARHLLRTLDSTRETPEDSTTSDLASTEENMKPETSSSAAGSATSAKAEATPGPWTVGSRGNIVTDIAAPNYTKAVATVWTHKRDPGDSKSITADPEGAANARLIASAPALLAALEAMMENCPAQPNNGGSHVIAHRYQTINQARAAIAQAREKG